MKSLQKCLALLALKRIKVNKGIPNYALKKNLILKDN